MLQQIQHIKRQQQIRAHLCRVGGACLPKADHLGLASRQLRDRVGQAGRQRVRLVLNRLLLCRQL